MATQKTPLKINLRLNTNNKTTSYGKYYPEIESNGTLSQRGLVEHILKHGSLYGRDVIDGVLIKMTECITELVSEGKSVKLDGLGTFYPVAESVQGGLSLDQLRAKGFNAADAVAGIHVRFLPDNTALDAITSRAFKKRCSLAGNAVIDSKEINGKSVAVRYNLSDWLKAQGVEAVEPTEP